MVTKFKTYFKTAALLFSTALISFNCQQEDSIKNDLNPQNSQRFTVKTLNKEQVQTNKQLMDELNRLVPDIKKVSDTDFLREIYNEEYDFSIDTDLVKLIEDTESDYRSYNFPLTRENPEDDKLENLMLTSNGEDGYDAYIVKYGFTNEELETIGEEDLNIRTTVYTSIDFDTSVLNSDELARDTPRIICDESWVWANTGNTDQGELVGAGNEGTDTHGWVLQSRECYFGGTGGGTSTAGTGNTASNGNTTDSCNTCGANGPNGAPVTFTYVSAPTPTAPNVKFLLPEILNITDPSILSWLNDKFNKVDATAVYDYLNEYNCAMINASSYTACEDSLAQASEILAILSVNPDFDYIDALNQFNFEHLEVLTFAPDSPIEDINEYLECFDLSLGAEVTIYINQPIAGQDDAFTSGNDKAGHAFIGISQGNITRSFGLYPEDNASPFSPDDDFIFGNNQSDAFDVSITFTINQTSLNNIIDDATSYWTDYDLNSNNCTDYVIQVGTLCGLSLPDPQSTWMNGGGSNPGAFGQAVRNMALPNGMTRDLSGGNSMMNNGDCNDN